MNGAVRCANAAGMCRPTAPAQASLLPGRLHSGFMRIGYFGGSFDPPHRGHRAVARAVRERFVLDRVLLAPTGRQPLKPDGPTASFEDRLRMTALLCAGEPGLEASDIDAPRPDGEPNYTADTLRRLRALLPEEARMFGIVGADAYLSMPQWREAGALFALAEWIVVSRPGVSLRSAEAMAVECGRGARIHLLPDLAEPASATDLRERLLHDEPCDDLLTPEVMAYIRKHRLYGS